MTPEEKKNMENEIKNNFDELQKKLTALQSEITNESNVTKKQEKQAEFDRMKSELDEIKKQIDMLSSLQEQDLQALKTRLEQYSQVRQDVQWKTAELLNQRMTTPTTYELLKWSETSKKLITIISSNPDKFKSLPWDTPETKLEYVFSKIHNSVVLFLKNKLWKSEKYDKVINNTVAPAFEWSMMEMLKDQWNETNTSMLQWMNKISWGSFEKLVGWVWDFAKKTKWSFDKFSQWVNAIDYLSVHNGVLHNPEKSGVLTNPIEFKNYLNDAVFASNGFSPYNPIDRNIFKVDESQTFWFGMSLQEKQNILNQIWNIQVVNNPKTTALIVKMLDKPEKFLWATAWLQSVASSLLDWANAINSVTKIVWIDLLWEITKPPEARWFWYRIIDFVCKLIWMTWWLEWIVKKWRLNRLNLTDEKNENITKIFKKYQKLAWVSTDLSITDANSCLSALANFDLTDLDKSSTTKWDYLRDVIAENLDLNLVSPSVVQQTLWNDYLKKEIITDNWKQKEKISIDLEKITEEKKKELAHKHILNMKTYLWSNFDDLKDFYANIHNTDDLVLCMTTALYANKEDVIEWIKAKVFLPENYWVIHWSSVAWSWNNWVEKSWETWSRDKWWENLDSTENTDKQVVSEQWVYDKAKEYGITDNRQIAYILSTIKWESWFKNQKEIWWENRSYWKVDSVTWKAYYGRWFIQITHKSNYEKYNQIIKDSWKDFKDNNGNIIKWSEIDLVKNPDIILKSNDLAIFIAMDWMKNWWPSRRENKKLDHYINDNKQDYYNARIIINWMSSNPGWYAKTAQTYLNMLWNNQNLQA